MNTLSATTLILCLLLVSAVPAVSYAQLIPCGQSDGKGKIENPCDWYDLMKLINNIIDELIKLAIPVSAIIFAYAGFLLMTTGVADKRSKARTMMLNVAIGLAIILAAWIITEALVAAIFTQDVRDAIPVDF